MAVMLVIDVLDGYVCKFIYKSYLFERFCKTKNEITKFKEEMERFVKNVEGGEK